MIDSLLEDLTERSTLARGGASAFNPFDLLVRREIDLSRVLGWLLDPRGTHGLGTAPLESFVTLVGLPGGQLDRSKVQLEQPIGKGANGGRIDILIRHPAWTLALENKPWTRIGEGQLGRYMQVLRGSARQSCVAVLLGAGWSDQEIEALVAREGVRCLRLGSDVRQWVATCAARAADPMIQTFLTHFEAHLGQAFGVGEDTMQDLKPVFRTPATVSAAVAIIEAQPALAREMTRRFIGLINRFGEPHGLRFIQRAGDKAMFGPDKNGVLRIDVGDAQHDFALGCNLPWFRQLYWGVYRKAPLVSGKRIQAQLFAHLEQVLGPAQPAEAMWPWWDEIEVLDPSRSRVADAPTLWAWAADESDEGLAAILVGRAVDAREALRSFVPA